MLTVDPQQRRVGVRVKVKVKGRIRVRLGDWRGGRVEVGSWGVRMEPTLNL